MKTAEFQKNKIAVSRSQNFESYCTSPDTWAKIFAASDSFLISLSEMLTLHHWEFGSSAPNSLKQEPKTEHHYTGFQQILFHLPPSVSQPDSLQKTRHKTQAMAWSISPTASRDSLAFRHQGASQAPSGLLPLRSKLTLHFLKSLCWPKAARMWSPSQTCPVIDIF